MTPAEFLWQLGAAHGPVHVVDIGANPIEGDAPYKRLLAQGNARVTGFEPQPEALARLNAAKSASPRDTAYAAALTDSAYCSVLGQSTRPAGIVTRCSSTGSLDICVGIEKITRSSMRAHSP